MTNERLRTALLQRSVSVENLAAACGVDPKTAERWINAGRIPYRRHRFAASAFLSVDEVHLWPNALDENQLVEASENEILNLYPHRWVVPRDAWGLLFGGAKSEIAILVYSGMFLADDPGLQQLLREKAAAGVRIRILLGDPDSEQVGLRGDDEGIDDAMAAKIRNVIVLYGPLRKLDGVEVRLHSTVLYNSIYRADDEVLVNTHVYGVGASVAPVMHLRKVSGGSMVITYLESFERVWSQARPLD
jgi:transcriptional regulator with XRE-family HTH domain